MTTPANLTKAKGDFRIKASCIRGDMGNRVFVGYEAAFVAEANAWKFKTREEAEVTIKECGLKFVFVAMVAS